MIIRPGEAPLRRRPYHVNMIDKNGDRRNLELLLRFSEFADVLDKAFSQAGGRSVIKDNVSLVVMCSLELDGPQRPGDLCSLTGLTSGGMTKVVTRLEDAGVVTRERHALVSDGRAVSVSLTASGHALMALFASELASRKADTDILIKELSRLAE